jgi:hypothetical protein
MPVALLLLLLALASLHCGAAAAGTANRHVPVPSGPASCNVVSHGGARGDGGDDTVALQRTLSDPACAEVFLPAGRTFSASVLWVRRSDVILTISRNATLRGLPAKFRQQRPDCASEDGLEFNWRSWCALLRVESERNFTLRGEGTLEPGGTGGKTPDFYSALHVRSTAGVALTGVRVHCTAWYVPRAFVSVSHSVKKSQFIGYDTLRTA